MGSNVFFFWQVPLLSASKSNQLFVSKISRIGFVIPWTTIPKPTHVKFKNVAVELPHIPLKMKLCTPEN